MARVIKFGSSQMFTGRAEWGEENDCHRMEARANSMWVGFGLLREFPCDKPVVYADSGSGQGTGEGL
jgi:hypothetical protein